MKLPNDIVERFRDNEINVKKLKSQIKKALENQEYENVNPEKDGLFTENVFVPEKEFKKRKKKNQPLNIEVNGSWVHPIFGRISNMVNNNITPVIFVVGQQQYGKSKTAHYIAHTLHDKINLLRGSYNPKNQLIYNELEYLMASASFTRMAKINDEAEEYLNTKDRWDDFVKMVAGDIRTQSKRENVSLIVTPTYKNVAPQIRKHVNIMINMVGKRTAQVQVIEMKHNKIGSRGMDQKFIQYPYWKIPKIPKDLIKEWESIEDRFKGTYSLENLKRGLDKLLEEKEKEKLGRL